MHRLTVLAIHDPKSGMPDKEFADLTEYDNQGQAELRALRWLMYCPNDIVMLHEEEVLVYKTIACKNCGEPIEYRGDNVRIKWAHAAGYYACFPDGSTQAEPKEE